MDENPTTTGMAPARRQQFEADVAELRVKTGGSANEPRMVALGAALVVIGLAITVIGFVMSGSQADTRDVLSSVILAIVGLTVTVAGTGVFLRYSISRFLRFWLLRLIYEQQDR